MRILGIGHRSRVGKDEAARAIRTWVHTKTNSLVVVKPIAYAIKEAAEQLFGEFGMEGPVYYDDWPEKRQEKLPGLGKTPVELWVQVGAFGRQVAGEDYWIRKMLDTFPPFGGVEDVLIIPDVRVPAEVAVIRDHLGREGLPNHLLKISRPDIMKVYGADLDEALEGHDWFDQEICNAGSLDRFHKDAILAFCQLFPEVEANRKNWS